MSLTERFQAAGLTLLIKDKPIVRRVAAHIFQMDIKRGLSKNTRDEWFEMYIPEGVIVNVQAIDRDLGQVVLSVKEPKTTFEDPVRNLPILANDEKARELIRKRVNFRVKEEDIFKRNGQWFVRRSTTDSTRHFLVGRDERQLFMCQLHHGASSVQQAHDGLKAPSLTLAEGKQRGRTIRQGEWFFLNTTDTENKLIKEMLSQHKAFIQKQASIGRTEDQRRAEGHPHVADELIVLDGNLFKLEHGFPIYGREIFVRGKVKHQDHATVSFQSWRKVLRNNERKPEGSVGGGTWID